MSKLTKKSFLQDVALLAAEYRHQIDAECDGFSPDPAPAARDQRRLQVMGSFHFFAQTYFPHYVKHSPATVHDISVKSPVWNSSCPLTSYSSD